MSVTEIGSTEALFSRIRNAPEQFAEHLDDEVLCDNRALLSEFIKQEMYDKEVTPKNMIIKTTLSQSHIYQILSGTRAPGRDVLINIALALSLDLERTQYLLKLGQVGALYPKIRRDAAIICCIEQQLDLIETNEYLLSISEQGLV